MGGDKTSRDSPPGWSDRDSTPLIKEKAIKRDKSQTDRQDGVWKDLSAKGRMVPGPVRAQPRKWMRIDENGGLSYIAVGPRSSVLIRALVALSVSPGLDTIGIQFDSSWNAVACEALVSALLLTPLQRAKHFCLVAAVMRI